MCAVDILNHKLSKRPFFTPTAHVCQCHCKQSMPEDQQSLMLISFSRSFFFQPRYHCHTLPPASLRAVETVTQSKVLWIGTPVPSCQPTNCQVSGTLPTPTEENTVTTTLLHTRSSKVCRRIVRVEVICEGCTKFWIVRNLSVGLEVNSWLRRSVLNAYCVVLVLSSDAVFEKTERLTALWMNGWQ